MARAMSKGPQRIRGTQDIWGEEADRFNAVVDAFDRVRRLYAFQRVEMPVFEATEVFARSIGETTDIVSKEMYTFPDRGGDPPHAAARIHRRHLPRLSLEGWQQHAPIKLATHGPVFRYERPQKGRFRQFHQLDAEIIGTGFARRRRRSCSSSPTSLLRELGICRRRHAAAQHARRRRDPRRLARGLIAHFEAHGAACPRTA